MFVRSAVVVGIVLSLATSGSTWAQAYPTKPVRMDVPCTPGGGTDVIGRVLAQKLTAALGQQVIVDNRPGAGGRIGGELVARAPADGYTLLFAGSSVMVTAPALYSKLAYEVPKDFAAISFVASTAYVLVVHPSVPVRSVRDFIGLAKRTPGTARRPTHGTPCACGTRARPPSGSKRCRWAMGAWARWSGAASGTNACSSTRTRSTPADLTTPIVRRRWPRCRKCAG